MSAFPSRLRNVRGHRSQAQFAAEIGVKVAAYGHYETGRSEPSLSVILKIVEVTGVSAGWLLGINEDANQTKNERAEIAERKLEALKKGLTALLKEY